MNTVDIQQVDDETKVERFEVAFNKIHLKLKDLINGNQDHAPFSELLYLAKNKRNVIHENFELLKKFSHLRNTIVHEKVKEGYYIAAPHIDIVREIEMICELLWRPPLALSIASQPVIIRDPQTSLEEILAIMKKEGFSQIPIYDEMGFKGLVTEGGIVNWFSKNVVDGLVSIEGIKAGDILSVEKPHNVHFISRKQTIYNLEDIFEEYFNKNQKLEAILITEHGKRTQKPIGIVTSWDLVQIDNTALLISNHI